MANSITTKISLTGASEVGAQFRSISNDASAAFDTITSAAKSAAGNLSEFGDEGESAAKSLGAGIDTAADQIKRIGQAFNLVGQEATIFGQGLNQSLGGSFTAVSQQATLMGQGINQSFASTGNATQPLSLSLTTIIGRFAALSAAAVATAVAIKGVYEAATAGLAKLAGDQIATIEEAAQKAKMSVQAVQTLLIASAKAGISQEDAVKGLSDFAAKNQEILKSAATAEKSLADLRATNRLAEARARQSAALAAERSQHSIEQAAENVARRRKEISQDLSSQLIRQEQSISNALQTEAKRQALLFERGSSATDAQRRAAFDPSEINRTLARNAVAQTEAYRNAARQRAAADRQLTESEFQAGEAAKARAIAEKNAATDRAIAEKKAADAVLDALGPYRQLGLSLKDVKDGAKDGETFLQKIARGLEKIGDESKRTQIVKDLGLEKLGPLWEDGAKGMLEFMKQARATGRILSDPQFKIGQEFNAAKKELEAAFVDLKSAAMSTVQQIGLIFAPDVTGKTNFLTNITRQITDFIDKTRPEFLRQIEILKLKFEVFLLKNNIDPNTWITTALIFLKDKLFELVGVFDRYVIPGLSKMMAGFDGLAAILNRTFGTNLSGTLLAFGTAIGAIALSFSSVRGVLGALLSPLVTLLGLLTPLLPLFLVLGPVVVAFWSAFKRAALNSIELLQPAFIVFRDALKKLFAGDTAGAWNDFKIAGSSAFDALIKVGGLFWEDVKKRGVELWPEVKRVATETFEGIKALAGTIWDAFKESNPEIAGPIERVAKALGTVFTVIDAILDKISVAFSPLAAGINNILGTDLSGKDVALLALLGRLTGTLSELQLAELAATVGIINFGQGLGTGSEAIGQATTGIKGLSSAASDGILKFLGLKPATDAVSGSFRVFGGLLSGLFGNGIPGAPEATKALTDAGQAAQQAGEKAKTARNQIISVIPIGELGAVAREATAALGQPIDTANELIGRLNGVATAFKAVRDAGALLQAPALPGAPAVPGTAPGASPKAQQKAIEKQQVEDATAEEEEHEKQSALRIQEIWRGVYAQVASAAQTAFATMQQAANGVVPVLQTDASTVDLITQAVGRAGDAFDTLGQRVQQAMASVDSSVRNTLQTVSGQIDALVSGISRIQTASFSANDTVANDGALFLASGGHVRGPGTGTSDSILAWLSNGEYVVKASAVRALGPQVLHALNNLDMGALRKLLGGYATGGLVRTPMSLGRMSLPRFADGGLVAASAGSPAVAHFHLPGGSVAVPTTTDVLGELSRAAAKSQVASAGRAPGWVR